MSSITTERLGCGIRKELYETGYKSPDGCTHRINIWGIPEEISAINTEAGLVYTFPGISYDIKGSTFARKVGQYPNFIEQKHTVLQSAMADE